MSYIELKYYLADYTLYSMGRMGGHCLRKHPDLAVQFLAQMAIVNKNSQTLQQQTEEIAKRAFERAFPGEGTSKLYQQEEWDADQAFKAMTFSKENCTSIASALEAMADDPADFVWIFVNNVSFRPTRIKVQQCG